MWGGPQKSYRTMIISIFLVLSWFLSAFFFKIGPFSDSKNLPQLPVSISIDENENVAPVGWLARPTVLQRTDMSRVSNFEVLNRECNIKKIPIANCLKFLDQKQYKALKTRDVMPKKEPIMIFHTFWAGYEWNEKLEFIIKSWLFTQRLGKAQLWIWLERQTAMSLSKDKPLSSPFTPFSEYLDGPGEPKKDPTKTFLVFRRFEPENYANIPGFEIPARLLKSENDVTMSDLARVVLLHQYGGLYLDVDTLILRDYSDLYLAHTDFAYRWGYENYINTAVFYLNKGSDVAKAILEGAIKHNSSIREQDGETKGPFHPYHFMKYIKDTTLYNGTKLAVLPCPPFDPLWLTEDKDEGIHFEVPLEPDMIWFNELFDIQIDLNQPQNMKGFFAGAWSIHYHGQWDAVFADNWMGLWNSLFSCFLRGKCENLYGELFKINGNG